MLLRHGFFFCVGGLEKEITEHCYTAKRFTPRPKRKCRENNMKNRLQMCTLATRLRNIGNGSMGNGRFGAEALATVSTAPRLRYHTRNPKRRVGKRQVFGVEVLAIVSTATPQSRPKWRVLEMADLWHRSAWSLHSRKCIGSALASCGQV